MLATKIIPSFYVLEIEGTAVEAIIPGNFGIAKVSIGSRDFSNDLSAMSALSDAMVNITASIDLNSDNVQESVAYNPEFFPSVPTIEPSEIEVDDGTDNMTEQEFDDVIEGVVQDTEHYVLELSRNFDPLGDFVEARWIIKSPEFFIRGKIAVNPEKYMQQKAHDITHNTHPIYLDKLVPLH